MTSTNYSAHESRRLSNSLEELKSSSDDWSSDSVGSKPHKKSSFFGRFITGKKISDESDNDIESEENTRLMKAYQNAAKNYLGVSRKREKFVIVNIIVCQTIKERKGR